MYERNNIEKRLTDYGNTHTHTLSLSLSLQNITCHAHARLTPLRPYKLMQLILVRAFKSRPRKPIGNHEELFCLATLLSASLRGWEIISFVLRCPSIFLYLPFFPFSRWFFLVYRNLWHAWIRLIHSSSRYVRVGAARYSLNLWSRRFRDYWNDTTPQCNFPMCLLCWCKLAACK